MKTRINLASTILGMIFLIIKIAILYLLHSIMVSKEPLLFYVALYFLISTGFAAITFLIWTDPEDEKSKDRDSSDVWKEKYLNTYILQLFTFPLINTFFIIWESSVKLWEYYIDE